MEWLEGLIGAGAVTTLWTLAKILAIVVPVILCVALLTLAERKVIGYMQLRLGPNRVTFFGVPYLRGWAQPFADVFKLVFKEVIIPTGANKFLFLLGPMMVLMPAMAA
ncbi:MAG: NADH-quinone oxidoreductase subunit H, partial [Burkholderiales bacterium]